MSDLTVEDAANRVTVRLPEGGLGTLVDLRVRSGLATVRTMEGRHRRLPVRSISRSEVEITPLQAGERRYGGGASIGAEHPDPPTSVDVS